MPFKILNILALKSVSKWSKVLSTSYKGFIYPVICLEPFCNVNIIKTVIFQIFVSMTNLKSIWLIGGVWNIADEMNLLLMRDLFELDLFRFFVLYYTYACFARTSYSSWSCSSSSHPSCYLCHVPYLAGQYHVWRRKPHSNVKNGMWLPKILYSPIHSKSNVKMLLYNLLLIMI